MLVTLEGYYIAIEDIDVEKYSWNRYTSTKLDRARIDRLHLEQLMGWILKDNGVICWSHGYAA